MVDAGTIGGEPNTALYEGMIGLFGGDRDALATLSETAGPIAPLVLDVQG